MIDLRSDTVTLPTSEMRRAMASAPVGDDLFGEDPTVNRLQEMPSEIFEREEALFVPSGTMGNQIAVKVHTNPGQEVIVEARSHMFDWEMAMMAALSGCLARPVEGRNGHLSWPQIEKAIRDLKKKLTKEGFFSEIKERRFYDKPSVQRKKKQAKAAKRRRKRMRKFP